MKRETRKKELKKKEGKRMGRRWKVTKMAHSKTEQMLGLKSVWEFGRRLKYKG